MVLDDTSQTESTQEKAGEHAKPISVQLFGLMRVSGKLLSVASKPRQIFALLALNAGLPVSLHEISHVLWGEQPPKTFVATIQTYILKLREQANLRDVLLSYRGGYKLEVRSEDVDVLRALKDIQAAEALLMNGGDLDKSRQLLVDVRSTGKAFLANTSTDNLQAWVVDVEERMRKALMMYFEVMLKLDRHREVLEDILRAWRETPDQQDLAIWAMKALNAAARPGDATQVYAKTRKAVVENYGLSPCSQLEALHRAILNSR